MFDKFGEAFSLLFKHIRLFSAIALTVWLPGNIVLMLVTIFTDENNLLGIFYATMCIEIVFSPLYVCALIYALSRIKAGHAVTYKEAMTTGIRKWFALFAARFIASLIITLGLILFIVPGVMLALRYAFLDPAVILEDKGIAGSRARSTALTKGKRWEILGVAALFFLGIIAISVLFYLPFGVIEALELSVNLAPVELVVDCVLSVAYLIIHIVLFLYFWEAVKLQKDIGPPVPGGQKVPA